MRKLVFFILLFLEIPLLAACFDPRTEPSIRRALTPNPAYHETPQTIEQIHRLIFSHRHQIDPRLVYYRLVGESNGQPFAQNPSGAYGLFQFLGKPYRSNRTHREILEDLYEQNPGVSPRLIQVRYYMLQYLQNYIRAADAGLGCNRAKDFADYTDLEKASYLGWGSCSENVMRNKELATCEEASDYNGACAFTGPLLRDETSVPLCGN